MKRVLLITSFIFGLSLAAQAETPFQEELSKNIDKLEIIDNDEKSLKDDWTLKRIRIRLRAKGGLDAFDLAKFEIKPSVEFFLDRK
jgi:hypothetical protein